MGKERGRGCSHDQKGRSLAASLFGWEQHMRRLNYDLGSRADLQGDGQLAAISCQHWSSYREPWRGHWQERREYLVRLSRLSPWEDWLPPQADQPHLIQHTHKTRPHGICFKPTVIHTLYTYIQYVAMQTILGMSVQKCVCTAIILCPDTLRFSFQTLTCIYTCTWTYSAWSALYMIVCTWHTGGYPQCDLNTVNGGLPDIEVRIRTARDHTAKNLALERQVSRWLIFIWVSLVGLEQLEQCTHCSLSL